MTTLVLSPPSPLGVVTRYSPGVSAVSQEPASLDARFALGAADLREAYDAHGALVYSLCRRSLDDESAQDVTQDVFVSAWRGRRQFDPQRGSLAGWLVGITKRRIIDHHRSESRHAERRDHSAELPLLGERDEQVEGVADRLLVADGLRHLPDDVRRVIELCYVHDLTHQEIADRTDIPLGTVKSHIRRGLVRIREHVERAGQDAIAGAERAGRTGTSPERRGGSAE